MKIKIIGMIVAVMLLVGNLPSVNLGTKIEWTAYLGMPLVIIGGSVGVSILTKRLEALMVGAVIGALWPVFYEIMRSVFH